MILLTFVRDKILFNLAFQNFAIFGFDLIFETNLTLQMDSAATSAQYTKELALRSTNWQVSPKLEQNIHWATDRIFVDVNWSENRFSPNPVVVHVQHSPMPSTEKASIGWNKMKKMGGV